MRVLESVRRSPGVWPGLLGRLSNLQRLLVDHLDALALKQVFNLEVRVEGPNIKDHIEAERDCELDTGAMIQRKHS
jgi:hypothetical protein